MSENVKANLSGILDKIKQAEKNSGRNEGSVKLLAVSKFHPQEEIIQAIEAGQTMFGENRVQEAGEKFPSILEKYPETRLHIIGQLQSNKVKKACELACLIESVDRLSLIQEIEKQCSKLNKTMEIFLEFHTAEDSKSGFETEDAMIEALNYIKAGNAPHVIPKGFMTMAPFTEDAALIKKSFSIMKETSQKLQVMFPEFDLKELSMGMSGDFEYAIQEGSTEVRVGTAIFGQRDYSK